jgi:hypothetical protein
MQEPAGQLSVGRSANHRLSSPIGRWFPSSACCPNHWRTTRWPRLPRGGGARFVRAACGGWDGERSTSRANGRCAERRSAGRPARRGRSTRHREHCGRARHIQRATSKAAWPRPWAGPRPMPFSGKSAPSHTCSLSMPPSLAKPSMAAMKGLASRPAASS